MTLQRFLLPLGSGVDLHGLDHTKAACRAVEDAIRRTRLNFLRLWGLRDWNQVHIEVTIGVPEPGEVDVEAVKAVFPFGEVEVGTVVGGLEAPEEDGERTRQ